MLLQLLRSLLTSAIQDERQRIPIVYHLASWAKKRQPFDQWFVAELSERYDVPPNCARSWVAAGRLIPLLDGLDEVPEEAREGCALAIKAYHQSSTGPLVACSSLEYPSLNRQGPFARTLAIQPLSERQIEEALASMPKQAVEVETILRERPAWREAIRTPLLLHLLATACRACRPLDLSLTDGEQIRRQLYAAYGESAVVSRNGEDRETIQQRLSYLTWLAFWLKGDGQREFRPQQILPHWLPSARWRWIYRVLMALYALPVGVLLYVLYDPSLLFSSKGIDVFGAFTILFDVLSTIFIFSLSLPLKNKRRNDFINNPWSPIAVIIWGQPFLALLPVFSIKLPDWTNALAGKMGFVFVPLASLLSPEGKWFVVKLCLLVACWGLLRLYQRGQPLRPGQWLRLAFMRALLSCLLCLVVLAALGGLSHGMGGLLDGLRLGLVYGIIVGLCYGGHVYIEHYLLRLYLWRLGCLPLRLLAFLDGVVERGLLYRVGDAYVFRHQQLFEYFADLELLME